MVSALAAGATGFGGGFGGLERLVGIRLCGCAISPDWDCESAGRCCGWASTEVGLIVVSLVVVVVVVMVVGVVVVCNVWLWAFVMEVFCGEVVRVWCVVLVVRMEGRDGADGLPAGGK